MISSLGRSQFISHRVVPLVGLAVLVTAAPVPAQPPETLPAFAGLNRAGQPGLQLPPVSSTVRRMSILLAAGGLGSFLATRIETHDGIRKFADRDLVGLPVDAGDAFGSTLTLGVGTVGLWTLGTVSGSTTLKQTSGDMLKSLLLMSAAVSALKVSLDRTRPNGGRYGFPSGHTASAFTAATVLDKRLGHGVGVPAYTLAVFTGLGRMEDRKHYLTDVVFGAAIGIAAAHLIVGSGEKRSFVDHLSVTPKRVGVSFDF